MRTHFVSDSGKVSVIFVFSMQLPAFNWSEQTKQDLSL